MRLPALRLGGRSDGDLIRIGSGLHQHPEAEIDSDLTLAEMPSAYPRRHSHELGACLAWPGRREAGQNLGCDRNERQVTRARHPRVRIVRVVNIASLELTPIELRRLIDEIQTMRSSGCTGLAKG